MELDGARNAKYEAFHQAFKYNELPSAHGEGTLRPYFSPMKGTSTFKEIAEARKDKKRDPRELIAVGVLRPSSHNKNRNDLSVGVFVQKRRLMNHPIVESIRRISKGECTVFFTGAAVRRAAEVERPLRVGCSVGHHRVSAGTLGCFAQKRVGGGVGIISNNHVLADTNDGKPGDLILQPAKEDGGKKGDKKYHVAHLHKFMPIEFDSGSINYVDCAFAYLMDGIDRITSQFSDPAYPEKSWELAASDVVLEVGDPVKKVGRTTGLTRGYVEAIEVDNVNVNMVLGNPNRIARFDNQIVISGEARFSKGGDSGALILGEMNNPAGLLFAGTERGGPHHTGVTYANTMKSVLDALDVNVYLDA